MKVLQTNWQDKEMARDWEKYAAILDKAETAIRKV